MNAKDKLLKKNMGLTGLRDNEVVLAQTIISNAIYWKGFAVLILAVIFLLFAYQLTIFLALVAVVILIFAHLKKISLCLVVTNQRVLVRRGIMLVDTIQLQYTRIESVELQTTIVGQMLGYSTLMVSGTGRSLAFIPFVTNPLIIQSAINEILQQRDVSSQEHLEKQAHIQAEAIAEALDEHKDDNNRGIII